ncbi:carbohydrate kinase [Actinoplanes sp. DH11]|uniref:carbohydrate kinase family protein n=1 Tax=Actinoplanes sp. DH11 TaxID=2857011 RepID=UPI001E59091A|nr:carbohydrate kinase [Actinoplanes sp. DH11]
MLTVLGEAVIDLLPTDTHGGFKAHPGGSPLNVAIALARLGEPTTLLARFSRHAFGRMLHMHADRNGVTVTGPMEQPEPASLAVVSLDPDGVAEYDFYLEGTVDWRWRPAELTVPVGTTMLHTGSLTCLRQPGATEVTSFLTRLRQDGELLLSFDPNIRPTAGGALAETRQQVTKLVSTAHVVKASAEDLHALYPGESVTSIGRHWATLGPTLVVVTRGAEGALAIHGDQEVRRAAPPIEVVDTVGAGDAFTAGLLSALRSSGHGTPAALHDLRHDQIEAVVDRAIQVASLTCTRAGADAPHLADL